MKPWVMPYLKKLMPDPVLRLAYEKSNRLVLSFPMPGYEYFYYDSAPCDDLKDKIYRDISVLTGAFAQDRVELRVTKRGTFITHYDFTDPQTIDAGLHLYEHTPDYLRWLLERMIEEDFREGIVLVEKRLAEIGALDEENRFDL